MLAKLPTLRCVELGPIVFLVDDDESVRKALSRFLKLNGYEVETFASGAEFLARPSFSGVGCIVTDLRMPEMSGIELQQECAARGLIYPFLFITGHGDITDAVQAMKNGASDFLLKPVVLEDLRAQVDLALGGHAARLRQAEERQELQRRFNTLSPRERQVCLLVREGLLNKQVAARLGTSEKTVKVQRGRAARKLGVASTAGLIDFLHRLNPS
jgi:RNA polymerase sigma factor (sigma-70 family)